MIDARCHAPQPRPSADSRAPADIAIEDKETFAWIRGFRETVAVAAADVVFSDLELQVLHAFATTRRLPAPTRLGDAVRLTARLGGYLGRTRDPPPGHQVMWHGYARLQDWCEGFALRGG